VSTAVVADEPDASDPNLEDSGLVGAPLVARVLGGTVIDELIDEES
jgi:DNA polymerase III subunit gamma/tau